MKLVLALFLLTVSICVLAPAANAVQTDIVGPSDSNFGSTVTVLPNGNIVVTAPLYDIPAGASDVGAVFLYDGATLTLISTLTGSTANDQVGNAGVTVLTNGNFVVRSNFWDNGAIVDAGAVTWGNGTTGISGIVSSANSLIGSTAGDQVGLNGVTALANGNFVVRSNGWDNGAIVNAGAVTWGNGTTGVSGAVSGANSLVGSTADDQVGLDGVTALRNGNYVVRSTLWDNGAIVDAGAVTWGSGTTGVSGAVSSANSLIGSTAGDQVGLNGVTALTNGNFVVRSSGWDNGAIVNAGAVTWSNGTTGISGVVSSANSLLGSTAGDQVGVNGVTVLTNGNFVVGSAIWDNGAIIDAGAVTWGNGTTGISGVVSSANSLVGSTAGDAIGSAGVFALTNGNYVVASASWNNGASFSAGAVTWGSGTTGISGAVSSVNSLVGSTANDFVGNGGVAALRNGNYVVRSTLWDNGAIVNAGAVTWGSGTTGISGAVSSANSLVGSTADDNVGLNGVTALANGNYVVSSAGWQNGAIPDAGAVTWGSGTTGISGAVSSANSLVGSTAGDQVGVNGVTALRNGNYVVRSTLWNNGAIVDAGAVTWGSGTTGISGAVSSANSLVGSTVSDAVGNGGLTALTNGNYLVQSISWDNGAITGAGAVTWGDGKTGISGAVSSTNSLVGSTAIDGVGNFPATAFSNGNYVVQSAAWDNGAIVNAGAFSFGSGAGGTTGAITSGVGGGNSIVGTVTGGVNTFAFDATRNRLVVGRSASNTVSILSFSTTAIADGDITNAANWSAGVPDGLVTGIIPSGRTMSISTKVNAGMIHVQCGGVLTNTSSSAYVIGSIRRDFCSAVNEDVLFPVGDPTNYSPMRSSGVNGSGSITVSAIDGFMPGINATASSLSRYWSVSGSGVIADLTFHYVDADVNGTEANYRVFRRPISSDSLITEHALFSLNAAANTITANDVSQFSDWSASGQSLAPPTAAGASISGRVTTNGGNGLRNALVQVTLANGEIITARTGSFGSFRFDDIEVGQTVVLSVASKRYTFAPQMINLLDSVTDVEFVAAQE